MTVITDSFFAELEILAANVTLRRCLESYRFLGSQIHIFFVGINARDGSGELHESISEPFGRIGAAVGFISAQSDVVAAVDVVAHAEGFMALHHLLVGWRTVHRDEDALKVGVDDEWDLFLVLVVFELHNVVSEAPFRRNALGESRTACRVDLIAVHFMSLQHRLKLEIMQASITKVYATAVFGDLRPQET